MDAICWAARCGQLEILQKALQTSDVDLGDREVDAHGQTPLYHATECYYESVEETIQLLLKAGADLDSSGWNETPLELACSCQNFRAAMFLLKSGACIPEHLLLDCVSMVTGRSAGGFVPDRLVDTFIQLQRDIISELVIKHKVSVDRRPVGEEAETALTRAARDGEPSTVDLLLGLGASVDAAGSHQRTALMIAIERRHLQIVEILLAAGADVNLADLDGETVIFFSYHATSVLIKTTKQSGLCYSKLDPTFLMKVFGYPTGIALYLTSRSMKLGKGEVRH